MNNKLKNKIISIMLTLVMVIGVIPINTITASAADDISVNVSPNGAPGYVSSITVKNIDGVLSGNSSPYTIDLNSRPEKITFVVQRAGHPQFAPQVSAKVNDEVVSFNGTSGTIDVVPEWTAENKFTVNIVGMLQGKNISTTTFEFQIKNNIPITSISLPETVDVNTKETVKLTPQILPEDTTSAISWKSSDTSIATVTNGVVTGVKEGNATITASADGVSASCEVTVKNVDVTGITLNKTDAEIGIGSADTLKATVAPENATVKAVVWTSSDSSIASVDNNGTVTGKEAGTAVITATSADNEEVYAECKVKVKKIDVTAVSLNKTTAEIEIGKKDTLTATVLPENASFKDVIWSSSDSSIASVDENGVVTGEKAGTATIKVKSADNGELYAECKVTVKRVDVTGISLNKETAEIEIGKKSTLTATVLPENATVKDVVWTSSNNDVATVDKNGNVTGVSLGEVIIFATTKGKDANGSHLSASCTVTIIEEREEVVPTVIYTNGVEGTGWPYKSAYINTITISGANVKSYTWSGDTCDVVLKSTTAEDAEIEMSITKAGTNMWVKKMAVKLNGSSISDKGTIQLEKGKADNVPLYVDATFKQGTKYFNFSIAEQNNLPTLVDRTNIEAEATVTGREGYSLNVGELFTDADEGDVLSYNVSVDDGESVPITLDENGLYTHTTDLPGTYILVFTATDSKGDTSKDKYTVTLNVVNSSETYDAIVNIPEGIEPDFYINDGFDTDGNPVNGEELKSAKEGIIDGLVKYSVKVPDNIEMINIDDGKRNIAAEVSRDTSVSFREAIVKVTDKFDTTVDGSVSVTYGDFTATPDEDGKYLLATENEYTLTATPKDTKSFKVETVAATVENGTGVAEINAKVEFNNLKTVTAPTGADVKFYCYNKYYNSTELVCRGIEDKDDKTSVYYFAGATLPAGGGTFIYRVQYKDYAVKAGWTTNNVTVTFGEDDLKSNASVDYGSSSDSNNTVGDDGVLLNINGQNNLSLSVGNTKTLKAYRAWEIIPVSYNNWIITPDFRYNIITGDDVVQLTDKASVSTTDTDWKTITALKDGLAIIEVSYDAITVTGGQTWNGTYGATDPAKTGLMVVQVGGHDPSVKFGIDCFASQGSTTYSASNAREWDAEFDTLYFTGDYGELKLSPKASGKITDVAVSNDKGSSWKSLTSENGAYTAKIVHGNNIIRVTTEAGTAYQVVRGDKVSYSVIELDGDGDGLVEVGETARVIIKGLHTPIPKMAGNYNPGFKANSDGDSSVHIKYTFNDKTVKGIGTQYTFGAEGNYVDVTIPADYTEKTIDLTAGYIGLGVIGLTNFADGGDSHRNIPDEGCVTRGSETTFHTRSILPNITLTIGEYASANTPPEVAAGAIKITSVKLGQIFAINPETLFTDDDGNKLTYSVSVDGNESKAIDSAYRFEPKAEGEYVLTFTASDGEAEVSHSVTLSVEKADVSDDKDPVFDTSGKIEGYVTVSFEDNGIRDKDAVGLKYPVPLGTIIPKTKVPYVKGDTVADVTLRMLDAMNVGYEYSGTTKSGFYLGTIKDFVVDRVPYDKMGEFDAGEGSGWMITHNDEFIQAGASEFTVKDGDIVAWKYTCQLGADIGDSFYAKDVDSVIDMIDAIGEVTLNSAGKIASARAAYEMLDDIQKNKVSNYDDLLSAEKALAELVAGLQRPSYEEAYKVTGNYLSSAADRVTPTVNSTGGDWIIVGLERSGHETPTDYYNNVVEYVKENINEKGQLHSAKSTDNSRVVLALTAAGIDPTDVEGYNLLEGLADLSYIKKQGINGPIWALIAFDSHDYEIPEGDVTKDALIKEILDEQLEDGGWDLKGTAADADMTGMALQALAPYYNSDKTVKDAVDKALRKLSEIQNADGTFGSIDGPSAESCAQVIVALTALGIDPAADSRFVKNGLSVVDGLLVFAMEDGGFRHIVNGQLDGMATEQGYYALAAYDRFLNEKSSLYDMSDVELSKGKYTKEDTTDKITSEDKKETDKSKTKSINLKLTEKVTKEQLAQGKENHYCEETGVDARGNSNDILPWYIKLNVVKQEITDDQKAKVSEALGGEGEVFILKDIYFTNTKDGSEWQPTKPIKIKIPMVDIGDYENAIIVHITDDGKIELIKGTVKDGMIEFEADSFSLYGIAGTNTSINDLLVVEDDGTVIWPWIVIAIIALAAIAYIAYRRKREA